MPVPSLVFVLLWSLGQSGRNSGREEVQSEAVLGKKE